MLDDGPVWKYSKTTTYPELHWVGSGPVDDIILRRMSEAEARTLAMQHRDDTDQDLLSSSPIFCGHANEGPRCNPCDCDEDCYCKVHGNCGVMAARMADSPPKVAVAVPFDWTPVLDVLKVAAVVAWAASIWFYAVNV